MKRTLLTLLTALSLVTAPEARAVKVDYLWVIDNSPSMRDEQEVLSSTADAIAYQLANAQCHIDWRMAVAYTDLHREPTSDDTCSGAVGPGRRRVCPFTDDIDVFRMGTHKCAYVMPGTCGDRSERGFNASRVAIDRFLAGSGCEPVPGTECALRPEARVAVIYMTDTGEQTPNQDPPPGQPNNSVASWANYFNDFDPSTPSAERAQVHGILCPFRPDSDNIAPCSDKLDDPALYDRYSEVIDLMGGVEGSIRDDDQTELSETIGMIVDATIAAACCGDGTVGPSEQCDDGNTDDGDCCSSRCEIEPLTTVCRPAVAACDVPEFCTGLSPVCPADVFRPASFECRGAAGVCDAPEACTGTSPACRTDLKRSGTCRPAAGACDMAESCTGSSNRCPADGFVPNGSACNDANACTQADACLSGLCVGSNPVTCPEADQCHEAGSCDPATGLCSNPAKPDGSSCNDGNACTKTDTCWGEACVGGNLVVCTPESECHEAGTCDSATGLCSGSPAKPDGAPCDDEDPCTGKDTCWGERCVGAEPPSCDDGDACTDDWCGPPDGCGNMPVHGFARLTCRCDNGVQTAWCSSVPTPIERHFARACRLIARSGGLGTAKGRKLVKRAAKNVRIASQMAVQMGRTHEVTRECSKDLMVTLSETRSRAVGLVRGN